MTTRIRPAAAVLLSLVLAGACLVGAGALPAQAGTAVGGDQTAAPSQQKHTNDPVQRQVRTCTLYAGSGSYGMTCRGATGESASYAEILGNEPVPTCWHEDVPPGFKPPKVRGELPPGGKWYLRTCLVSGIDPETKQPNGRMRFSQEPEYVAPDNPIELLPGQEIIVAGVRDVRQIPAPFVQTSPSAKPRVGQQLAFYVPPANTVGSTISVSGPGLGTVQMRARQTGLQVWPLGTRPAPAVNCADGGVQITTHDTRETQPNACWWTFEHSSSDQRNNRYPMHVEANWVVEYNADGDWLELGRFTREQENRQWVPEVQTIVVP